MRMQECNFHHCNPHLILEKLGIENEEINCFQRLREILAASK